MSNSNRFLMGRMALVIWVSGCILVLGVVRRGPGRIRVRAGVWCPITI
jgi:hypothetical protein